MSRDRLFLRAYLTHFFPLCFKPSVVRLGQRGLSSLPSAHFLRVERQRDGGDRESCQGALRPRNVSVPSYRPLPTRGCTSVCASEAQVRGRGRTRSPAETCALWTGARAGVQAHAQGQDTAPLCSGAFVNARGASWQSTVARLRPLPGTVWSQDRGLASCCVAVCTMARARSPSTWSSSSRRARATSTLLALSRLCPYPLHRRLQFGLKSPMAPELLTHIVQ